MSRRKQSPIDIQDTVARTVHLPPLVFIGHWRNEGEAVLINDGEHATIKLSGDRIPSIIKCGPLGDEDYELHDVHFHWGEEDCCGSEHSLNSTWFSMEAHAVHWNRKYRAFEESLKYEDGLCILTYLFQVKAPCNAESYALSDDVYQQLDQIIEPGSAAKVPANCLYWMRSALHSKYYYVYQGSYNAAFDNPECATWVVFPGVMVVRSDQNDAGKRIEANRRAVQHLYERKIYKVSC
ncbi:carbonic anhydrase 2-like [Phymastichus coffea]|uniref:carbonic anhydrase 2-like n=1 Tax=Phymastichus coffea TaxID=108790 RepID=UPI00273CC36C|nr:carbonic anhydrase 2-like [Phymastichus coffea]